MAVVANIAVNLDSTRALAGLRGMDDAVKGLGGGIDRVSKAMSGLAGIAASIGAGAAVSGFLKAGIEADRTAKTIKALAGQYKETEGVTRLASDAAKEYGLGQTTAAKAVSDLYGRLRPMGISLADIGKTFNGVNKAASLMNLSAADTEGVLLQLSQAMGSGALQGDELRSIMERLPAVGQAVAKVMGVTVGEVKKLGSDGKITTDVIIKAMEELNKIKAPPPDSYKLFQAALQDLNTTIGTELLPIFTPLVQKLSEIIQRFKELGVGATVAQALKPLGDIALRLLELFAAMPLPLQEAVIQLGALAGAFSLIAAPLGMVLQGAGAVVKVLSVLSSLQIGATIAGWAPVIMQVVGALGALGKILIGVFSGPVGWVALAVAAGVAIFTFRDQIVSAFRTVGDAIKAPLQAAANFVRGIVNSMLTVVGSAMNSVVSAINRLIAGANRGLSLLRLPQIPFVPQVAIPRFAEGGMVSRPTLAMIGEGGEPEYVVPQSKAGAFSQNWINNAGKNGSFAAAKAPVINIQTGPVVQQDGQNYVSLADLEGALQDFADMMLSNGRSAGARRYSGVN